MSRRPSYEHRRVRGETARSSDRRAAGVGPVFGPLVPKYRHSRWEEESSAAQIPLSGLHPGSVTPSSSSESWRSWASRYTRKAPAWVSSSSP